MSDAPLKRWKRKEPSETTAPASQPVEGEVTLASDLPKNAIVEAVLADPAPALMVVERRDEFFEAVKAQTSQLVVDTSTAKGRAAIKSAAFAVTKMKTAIDAHGKKLKEEAQAIVTKVDAARKDIRDRLDALAEEVRKPLTEWEEAEAERVRQVDALIARLAAQAVVNVEDTSSTIAARIAALGEVELDPDVLRDRMQEARDRALSTLEVLRQAEERIVREEADRAELERLRQAEADRIAREAAAAAEEEARQAAIAAEEERLQREREAEANAAEAARLHAETLAAQEAAERERAHREELEAANRRAQEAEAAAQRERDRIAEAQRLEAERARDREHRGKILREAKESIMTHGVEEAVAKAIVLAIAAGEVPHTRITF